MATKARREGADSGKAVDPLAEIPDQSSSRCEGWRRYGGAFTLGPVRWEQCKNDGIVALAVQYKGEKTTQKLPACKDCWIETSEAEEKGDLVILSVDPLVTDTEDNGE